MSRAEYIEAPCKSAVNAVRGMPFRWSLNPYRGCVHSCHYCYARASHAFLGLDADRDFETRIFVKSNIASVLDRELSRPSWRGEQIAIGTATDAYQPCEGRFRLTRSVLDVMLAHRNPISIVTKSPLVVRDIDLLADLARHAAVRVYFTVTTLDPTLWRQVEPGTPPPAQRLRAMSRLAEAGVPVGVLMAPVMPLLNDSVDAIRAVAIAAADHGASSFHTGTLRLAPLVREHYFGFLDAHAPELIERYARNYATVNAPLAYQRGIERRVQRVREEVGFVVTPRALEPAHVTGERQLTLALALASAPGLPGR